jgi:hypothetical protein
MKVSHLGMDTLLATESAHYNETLGKLALILYFWIIFYMNIGFCWHQGLIWMTQMSAKCHSIFTIHRTSGP